MAGIMKAKKKPLDVVTDADLGVVVEPRVEVLRYRSTDTQRRCERVKSVEELAERLRSVARP
jgi:electron transfer flavoprotein beta subunit